MLRLCEAITQLAEIRFHPVTEAIIEAFPGSRIMEVKLEPKYIDNGFGRIVREGCLFAGCRTCRAERPLSPGEVPLEECFRQGSEGLHGDGSGGYEQERKTDGSPVSPGVVRGLRGAPTRV